MAIGDRPTRQEREELAATDPRSEDTLVLTEPTGAANGGYAYHDEADGEPRCGAGGPETEFVSVTVSDAQRRNKSPCQMCERLRD